MIFLLVIFAVMMIPMFLMSSRQRKAQRAHAEMVASLGIGDEVRTHSGFYGLIVDEYDDVVILETESGAQTKWARQAIAGKVEPTTDDTEAAEVSESSEQITGTSGDVPGVTTNNERS
ncbi:preprotein translocase subunit YajC [Devriesea agamarum]|uniref:preprotein translocase subunit YajC n=1 Tax=Devriesea agamarum TaxID=472569 RepID=UPI00071DE83F|nr:preprotein translocase subunit YajC [Devriesea agamarum]